MENMIDRLLGALSIFASYFDDSTSIFVIGVGLAIGLLALSLMYLIATATNVSRRRIRAAVIGNDTVSSGSRRAKKVDKAIGPLRFVVLPASKKERSETNKRLVSAGYRDSNALSVYYVWKLVLTISGILIAMLVTSYFPTMTTMQIIFSTAAAAFVGSVLPSYVLDKRVTERKRRIINAFPDMLDMLVACSEAGLGLNAALQRVAREIEPSFPDLGEELELVNAEMVAGVDRVKALKGLADRTDIDDIQSFVSMLSQSVRFGTGVAETLRIYAEDFRDRRMQKAEELAAKIGTKLLFPLVLCFFPCFFIVAVGPAAIALGKALAAS